jgi:hypothetical protein
LLRWWELLCILDLEPVGEIREEMKGEDFTLLILNDQLTAIIDIEGEINGFDETSSEGLDFVGRDRLDN